MHLVCKKLIKKRLITFLKAEILLLIKQFSLNSITSNRQVSVKVEEKMLFDVISDVIFLIIYSDIPLDFHE